ncbi:MAG: DUF234 domain-containing protein, partial [Anaerolineae bacterium]|nr:DUF234 domain-containing protein [Anaerolineae bacterium]
DAVAAQIREQLRGFLSLSAFEPLAQQWVAQQGRAGKLPFQPEVVGAHWSRRVQVDVVAINWTEKQILLGECKWGLDAIDRSTMRELTEDKTPKVLADLPNGGEGWRVTQALFTRRGITPAARAAMQQQGGLVVDLERMDEELG